MMMTHNYINRTIFRTLIIGTISGLGLLSGIVPSLSRDANLINFSSSAYAESFSDAEVTSFAQIVLEIEPTRQRLMQQIVGIVGSKNIPDIVCGIPQTIQSLPNNAEPLAKQLCNKYSELIQKHQITSARFEEIAKLVGSRPPADPNLKRRVDQKLIEIQKK